MAREALDRGHQTLQPPASGFLLIQFNLCSILLSPLITITVSKGLTGQLFMTPPFTQEKTPSK